VTYNQKLRQSALTKLGSKCVRCGFDDIRALQVDHIEGDGWKDRGKSDRMYKKILAGQEGYQLLCANCNWIKKTEKDENPRFGCKVAGVNVDPHHALLWSL